MKATIIIPSIWRRDAIGNVTVGQARLLLELGFDLRIWVGNVADVPLDLVDSVEMISDPSALVAGSRQRRHYLESRIAIFHYPAYYPMIDLIREKPRGVRLFDYHGVTPPALWDGAGR